MPEESLQERFYNRHKELFTSVVMPVILATTVLLIATHWGHGIRFYSGLAAIVLLDVFNVYFSQRQRPVRTPFGSFDSRSDAFDTFRWCINLPIDVFMLWCLGLDFTSASFSWLILTFGSLTEVYYLKNRLITVSVAFSCFLVITQIFSGGWETKLYVSSCYLGIIFILFRFERWLVDEMKSYYEMENAKTIVLAEAALLRREATIGNQTRTICHEINNLLTIMQGSLTRLQPNKKRMVDDRKISIARLERALGALTRISTLVLKDIGAESNIEREYPLEQLCQDLKLLLEKHYSADYSLLFQLNLPQLNGLPSFGIQEWTGASYLIIHNLTKNAVEATEGTENIRKRNVKVTLSVDESDLVVTIEDNGPGISPMRWKSITEDRVKSSKIDGNGLGMRFILDQVNKNGMQLQLDRHISEGTRFILRKPLVVSKPKEEAA